MKQWRWFLLGLFAVGTASGLFLPRGGDINAAPNKKAKAAAALIRCATPTPGENIRQAVRQKLAAAKQKRGGASAAKLAITIPVQFIHITSGAQGQITNQMRQDQLDVLNENYEDLGITFTSAGAPIVSNNAVWYTMGIDSPAEAACKSALHVNPETTLNFYTAGLSGGALGWATFPWDLASEPEMDGVVILDQSLPGGTAAPFNQGKTAVHEIGHWLGLYHTFQGGCGTQGDEVSDTVAHTVPNSGCPSPGRNGACSAAEQAPIHNYMNYTDDSCMTEFTLGQDGRVTEMVPTYRTELGGGDPPPPPDCGCAMECLVTRVAQFALPAKLLPQFRALRDNLLSQSSDGRRLIRLYYEQSGAVFRLLSAHPRLAIRTGKVLLSALPDDAGASGSVRLAEDLYEESQILLEHLASQADPDLAAALEDVRAILDRNATAVEGGVTLQFTHSRAAIDVTAKNVAAH